MGFTRQELAHFVCASQKQIEQLEEGGYHFFYSPQHKYCVAKKVANKLGLLESLVFIDSYDYASSVNTKNHLSESETMAYR